MIRMSNNVLAFAEQTNTKTLFEKFSDLWNHYLSTSFKKDKDYDKSLTFEQKNDKFNEDLKKTIADLAGVKKFEGISVESWASNPMYKWATFAVVGALVDYVIPDTVIDSIGMYTEVKTGGFGDNFSFDVEPNDLFYVTKSGRGKRHAEGQKSFDGQVIVNATEHDISVMINLMRVLSGKESLAKFAMKAAMSMETEIAYDAYVAFDTAMAAVPATADKELYYSGFSQDNFIELTDKVASYNNGAKAIVVGTRKAVQSVLPSDTNYRIQIDSDYVKIGYIREFFGVDVVVLPQKANWKDPYQTVLDDEKLYVMSPSGQKIVKLCIEGSTISITDDQYANANLTQKTTMKKNWGCGVATNAAFGCIDLS